MRPVFTSLTELAEFVIERVAAQRVPGGDIRPGRFGDVTFKPQFRDDLGNKCAAGHLIPDERYLPGVEYALLDEMLPTRAQRGDIPSGQLCEGLRHGGVDIGNARMLRFVAELQIIHDEEGEKYVKGSRDAGMFVENFTTKARAALAAFGE